MTHARERHCYGERAPTCRGVWSKLGGGVGGARGGSGAELAAGSLDYVLLLNMLWGSRASELERGEVRGELHMKNEI